MSECVVRMEVPENCYECDIYMSLFVSDCPIYQKDGGQGQKHKYTRSRHPDSPILAVLPEKHGELIDRQAVYEKIKWWQENTHDTVTKAMLHEFYLMLFGVPAIVPATEGGKE